MTHNYAVALEKRLDEIRRLEGVNKALLEAMEQASQRIEALLVGKKDHSRHPWVRDARDAIKLAKS